MFTKQELNMIGSMLIRTDIKGGEAVLVAALLQKIDKLIYEFKEEKPKPK